jgi:hypothetical protein
MRARPRFTAGLLTVLVLASGAATAAAASNAAWAGRPLSQALDRLRDLGLRLVYGSNVVHPGMFVFAEPLEESPRRILDEILAPHGLLAEETTSGILRIVFAPEGRVEGRVTDADSGSPIAGAEIEVESLASAPPAGTGDSRSAVCLPVATRSRRARRDSRSSAGRSRWKLEVA